VTVYAPTEYISFDDARATQGRQLGRAIAHVRGQLADWEERGLLRGPGPVLLGIGASHAAACAPVWALRKRGILAWRLGAGDAPLPYPRSEHPVIGVSQSGRSAETLEGLASVPPALRRAVANTSPSPLTELVDDAIGLGNLPDSYASTIGYTGTIAALGMLADAWDGGAPDAGWDDIDRAFDRVDAGLAGPIERAVELFDQAAWADVVASAPSAGTAEEGALLLREVARIAATGMSTRQYLHGSMESAGGGVHVVFGDRREIGLARTLVESGHRVVLVTRQDVDDQDRLRVLRLPERPAAQRAILEASVLQALSGGVARARGIPIEEFVFHADDIKVARTEPDPA
jgi:glucosamine--fructose-6-phosphate aminotransferase (isomerizing)